MEKEQLCQFDLYAWTNSPYAEVYLLVLTMNAIIRTPLIPTTDYENPN